MSRPRMVSHAFSLRSVVVCAFLALSYVWGAEKNEKLPDLLAPLFSTPAEYAGQLGSFRSPLKFNDGHEAKTPTEWAKRRQETRQRWFEVMGPWPPLLEKPRLTILEKTPRENFTQCRIEVEIAPGRMSAGYLLIPAGQPKFPAVFVPYY